MMSDKLDWTQQLGDAILAQQPDVMDAIQRLRQKAQGNNKLTSNQQQTVTTQQQDGKQVIFIAPTNPILSTFPIMTPPWFTAAGIIPIFRLFLARARLYRRRRPRDRSCIRRRLRAGTLDFRRLPLGRRYRLGRQQHQHQPSATSTTSTLRSNNWTHNPAHRQGVRYSNANVAQKFGGNQSKNAGGAQNRADFRGRTGDRRGGASRANVGGGNGRPNIGANAARSGVGNRNAGAGNTRANLGHAGGGGISNVGAGRTAGLEGARGRASFGGGGGGGFRGGGGGGRGGGGGGRGGGRHSDINLKHDIVLLARLDNGLGFYRFAYKGSERAYVGVMAQEVQTVMPSAVERGRDGYLRVFYDKLGVKFQTYEAWMASGAQLPVVAH